MVCTMNVLVFTETKSEKDERFWMRCEVAATKQRAESATYFWGISSAGRAPALHAGGQGFEPLILHHPV